MRQPPLAIHRINPNTDDADVERSRCAQCGKLNEPVAF
jgi:hypothetical protein